MSKQINKYPTQVAYQADGGRLNTKSAASDIQGAMKYDGVNVIVPYNQSNLEFLDIPVYDRVDGCLKLIKGMTYNASQLDTERFVFSGAAFVRAYPDHNEFVCASHILAAWNGGYWAVPTEYKLTLHLDAAGGFDWTTSIHNATKSGNVSWEAGADLASVIAQINAVQNCATSILDGTAVRIRISTYTGGHFTVSNAIGVEVLDCTESARIDPDGTPRGEHTNWQTVAVKTLFPALDYMAASSVQYAKNGLNLSYRCGCKLGMFKSWTNSSGKSEFAAESTHDPMKQSVFEALEGSEVEAEKALYEKYHGSWDEYMRARMYDENVFRGINALFHKAPQYTAELARCVFTDAEGNTMPIYKAASLCHNYGIETEGVVTGFEPGNWVLPTTDGLFAYLQDERMTALNVLFNKFRTKNLIADSYAWSVYEYHGPNAWCSNSDRGWLNCDSKCYDFAVRPVLALPIINH